MEVGLERECPWIPEGSQPLAGRLRLGQVIPFAPNAAVWQISGGGRGHPGAPSYLALGSIHISLGPQAPFPKETLQPCQGLISEFLEGGDSSGLRGTLQQPLPPPLPGYRAKSGAKGWGPPEGLFQPLRWPLRSQSLSHLTSSGMFMGELSQHLVHQ